ncbi:MAG: hypothetical protein N2746_06865 [Deltaproteobacteria bacterium]|nr:hypothetical protein [Deltaproteobacteria bacterium]
MLLFFTLLILPIKLETSKLDLDIIIDGVEYKKYDLKNFSKYEGELHIFRINPIKVKPEVYTSKEYNIQPLTAAEWCKRFNLNIATNLGMYHKDFSTHVGYLRKENYINNPTFNTYKSLLLMDPTDKDLPYTTIADIDKESEKELMNKYKTVVQNLRLIKGKRINVWKKTNQLWPEAGIGIDSKNNIIIFFTATPITIFELNEILLKIPMDIIKAFHTEGGPPASLSVHIKDFHLDLSGNITSNTQEPIPNILGFRIQR